MNRLSRLLALGTSATLIMGLTVIATALPAQASNCHLGIAPSWHAFVPPTPGNVLSRTSYGILMPNLWLYHGGDTEMLVHSKTTNSWGVCTTSGSNTSVQGYPEAVTLEAGNKLSTYTTIRSSASYQWVDMGDGSPPPDSHEEVAYDLWWNGDSTVPTHTEVMVWTNNHGEVPAGRDTGTRFTDILGNTYEVWWHAGNGSTVANIATFVRTVNTNFTTVAFRSLLWFLTTRSPYNRSPTANPSGIGTDPTFSEADFGLEIGTNPSLLGWKNTFLTWILN